MLKKQSAQKAAAFFLYRRMELSMMDKSIMIFLHGGGVSSWMWQEQVEIFKDTYECFAPDLIGHGTRAKEQIFSMNESAQEVISWIKDNANGTVK
nr:hypothetical protein P5627_01525 [Bacillus safensis]